MKFDTIQLCDIDIEVIDGDRGKNYPHQDELLKTGDCLFLSAKNVTKNGFSFTEKQFITKEKDKLLNNGRLKRGDIVITTRGTVGNVALYSNEICYDKIRINSGMLIIRCGDKIDNYYLYQVLRSKWFQNQILSIQSGSAQPQLPKSHFHRMTIPVPDVNTQHKIASILSSIDEKIVVNTAINENLEQQAQTLFKDMIKNVQEQVPFTSMIQVLGGGTPKTGEQEYWNGEIPFFTPKDVGSPYVLTTEKSITHLGLNNCNSRLYPVNTVFLTARGTVGKVSLAGVPMAMNQSCYALVGKNGLHQIIVYQYVRETVKALKHKASGAVFDAIITRDFDTENIPELSSEQIDGYIAVAEPIYSEIRNRTFENQRLATLRDTLLPKLMNGEIDVSEVKI